MRILELDGLRGIAVMAVMSEHYMSWLPITGAQNGWLGVDLFFILSGFLITSILVGLRGKEHFFSTFYSRRALRIFPPYFLAIAIYLVVSIAAGQIGTPNLWLQYIFYYSSLYVGTPPQLEYAVIVPVRLGLIVLWSLSVEELYYTFWAPIVRYTSHKSFSVILAGMIVAAPLLRWWLHTPKHPETFTFYCRMDALAYGSVLALLMRAWRQANSPIRQWDKLFNALAIIFPLLTVAVWVYVHASRASLLLSTVGLILADLSFASIVFVILRTSGSSAWPMRALRAEWLRMVGMVSYSLYLCHNPIHDLVVEQTAKLHLERHADAIVSLLLSVIASFALAFALWYGMESKILNWKDRNVPSPAHP